MGAVGGSNELIFPMGAPSAPTGFELATVCWRPVAGPFIAKVPSVHPTPRVEASTVGVEYPNTARGWLVRTRRIARSLVG